MTLILQDSVSNVGAVRAMETSTSTANTLRARHDHSQSTSFTHNQHDEHDGVLERPIASLVSSSSLGKERRYLSSSSSSVLSDSLASTNSLARQLSISRQTQSSSEEFSSGTQSRKLKNASATDEESVTLAMTVKLRKMSCSEGVDGKQEDEAASVESFEVYFEDDCGRTKDTSSPRLRSTISKLALNNSQPSTPIESLRSSVSDSDADDARESEADDNMSAITWPDPASQRVLDVTYAMYEQTAAVLPANAEPASDDTQQSDEKKSIFSDDDSLEGDSFLLELDALSLSWLQRKKALEEKKRALA